MAGNGRDKKLINSDKEKPVIPGKDPGGSIDRALIQHNRTHSTKQERLADVRDAEGAYGALDDIGEHVALVQTEHLLSHAGNTHSAVDGVDIGHVSSSAFHGSLGIADAFQIPVVYSLDGHDLMVLGIDRELLDIGESGLSTLPHPMPFKEFIGSVVKVVQKDNKDALIELNLGSASGGDKDQVLQSARDSLLKEGVAIESVDDGSGVVAVLPGNNGHDVRVLINSNNYDNPVNNPLGSTDTSGGSSAVADLTVGGTLPNEESLGLGSVVEGSEAGSESAAEQSHNIDGSDTYGVDMLNAGNSDVAFGMLQFMALGMASIASISSTVVAAYQYVLNTRLRARLDRYLYYGVREAHYDYLQKRFYKLRKKGKIDKVDDDFIIRSVYRTIARKTFVSNFKVYTGLIAAVSSFSMLILMLTVGPGVYFWAIAAACMATSLLVGALMAWVNNLMLKKRFDAVRSNRIVRDRAKDKVKILQGIVDSNVEDPSVSEALGKKSIRSFFARFSAGQSEIPKEDKSGLKGSTVMRTDGGMASSKKRYKNKFLSRAYSAIDAVSLFLREFALFRYVISYVSTVNGVLISFIMYGTVLISAMLNFRNRRMKLDNKISLLREWSFGSVQRVFSWFGSSYFTKYVNSHIKEIAERLGCGEDNAKYALMNDLRYEGVFCEYVMRAICVKWREDVLRHIGNDKDHAREKIIKYMKRAVGGNVVSDVMRGGVQGTGLLAIGVSVTGILFPALSVVFLSAAAAILVVGLAISGLAAFIERRKIVNECFACVDDNSIQTTEAKNIRSAIDVMVGIVLDEKGEKDLPSFLSLLSLENEGYDSYNTAVAKAYGVDLREGIRSEKKAGQLEHSAMKINTIKSSSKDNVQGKNEGKK